MSDAAEYRPDVEVLLHGTGRVWCKLLSDQAREWYFTGLPSEFWPYFHMRRYGDTPFGWYDADQDAGMVMLITFMLRARLLVDALDLAVDPDDEAFRHRLTFGDYDVTDDEKQAWYRERLSTVSTS